MSPATRLALVSLSLVGPVAAQGTYIVDAANGPGTTHLDVPAAVAAATHGDTIIVRPHPLPAPFGYHTATTSSGISIVGLPGARFTIFNSQPFTVTNLPADRDFTLQGFGFAQSSGIPALKIQGGLGRVHLDRLDLVAVGASGVEMSMLNSGGQLTMNECTVTGRPAVTATGSVALSRCTLFVPSVNGPSYSPALNVNSSSGVVSIDSSHCVGGMTGTEGYAAVSVSSLALSISGSSLIEAPSGATNPTSALLAYGGLVTVSTESVLLPRNGAPPIFVQPGVPQPTYVRLPTLGASGAPPGGTVRATLRSPVGELAILLASATYDRITVPPFGDLWFDPLGIFFITATFQDSSERWTVDIPLSPFARRGEAFALQGLSGPGLDVKLSNPVVVVIN